MRGLMMAGVRLSKLSVIMALRLPDDDCLILYHEGRRRAAHLSIQKRPRPLCGAPVFGRAYQPDMRLHSVMAAMPTTTMRIGQKASMALQPGKMHRIDPNTKPSIAE